MYQITPYSYKRAKELGVEIRPSTVKGKKLDVYENGRKIASIGDAKYGDFPTYLKEYGKKYADMRRLLFHTRTTKDTLKNRLVKYLLW